MPDDMTAHASMAMAKPFRFRRRQDDDDAPEIPIESAIPAPQTRAEVQVVNGIDLTGKTRVIFLVGRGKTGKTFTARYLADDVIENTRELIMADLDPTNATFMKWYDEGSVHRPDRIDDPAVVQSFTEDLLAHAAAEKTTLMIDMGGGDTSLPRIAADKGDLEAYLLELGLTPVLLLFVGPDEEDLTPLLTMRTIGFLPKATAVIQNEGVSDPAEEEPFRRILRHSVYRETIALGAIPVTMPRLSCAKALTIKQQHFPDAIGPNTKLNAIDRSAVRKWMETAKHQFSGIRSWLP